MDELDIIAQRRARRLSKKRDPHTPKTAKQRSFFARLCIGFCWFSLFFAVLGGVAGVFVFYFVSEPYKQWAEEFDLERINDLEKPSVIYDRHGEEIGRIFVENRSYVTLDKVAPCMINALIAQEDARFRTHPGYDLQGMLRAVKEYIQAGGNVNQGASTLAQQLARNAYNLEQKALARGESKLGRKIVEIYLAIRITERYDRDQILEFYLNRVYLGSGFHGIRAASLGYFGKEPKDLTTREAASIAALIKNPTNISPFKSEVANKRWRNHVLDRMVAEGFLEKDEAKKLQKMPIGLNPKPLERGTSHIYDRIATQVTEYLGEDRVNGSGLAIYTTLDKRIQHELDKSLTAQIDQIEQRKDYKHPKMRDRKIGQPQVNYLEGAGLVIDNQTGAILAYQGGRDFARRQYDAIELGARPPGTAMLPFMYATAFENGYSPVSLLSDEVIDNRLAGIGGMEGILGEWGVEAEKTRYEGQITARRALSLSKIAASLRLGMEMGTKPFLAKLGDLGIRKPERESGTEAAPVYRPRVFVGTESVSLKELTRAYTVFPNGGTHPDELYFLDKIKDEKGYTIWESPQSQGNRSQLRAMKPETSFQIHDILQQSLATGTARRIKPLLPAQFNGAVKTGTNYDFADHWLFGYNSRITCGIWIGFLNGKQAMYPNAFASDTCGSTFASIMKASEQRYPAARIQPPASISEVEICQATGKRASKYCYELEPNSTKQAPRYRRNTYKEYFPSGAVQMDLCDVHSAIDIDTDLGLIPTGDTSKSPLEESSRILPVVPILPVQSTLLGKDPYQTELGISPRYLHGVDTVAGAPAEFIPEAQAVDDGSEPDVNENALQLPEPPPIRIAPLDINL